MDAAFQIESPIDKRRRTTCIERNGPTQRILNSKANLKFRVYKTCLTLASIAVIIEVLGAGRRFC